MNVSAIRSDVNQVKPRTKTESAKSAATSTAVVLAVTTAVVGGWEYFRPSNPPGKIFAKKNFLLASGIGVVYGAVRYAIDRFQNNT